MFVQWHNVAIEDEMDVEELVSTGTFQKKVPHHARVLHGSDDGELVTYHVDDDEIRHLQGWEDANIHGDRDE